MSRVQVVSPARSEDQGYSEALFEAANNLSPTPGGTQHADDNKGSPRREGDLGGRSEWDTPLRESSPVPSIDRAPSAHSRTSLQGTSPIDRQETQSTLPASPDHHKLPSSDREQSVHSRTSMQGTSPVDRQDTQPVFPESPDHQLPVMSDADLDDDHEDDKNAYTPGLPAEEEDQDIERPKYESPPPYCDTHSQADSQTELLSPQRGIPLIPVGNSQGSGAHHEAYPSEKMVPLPPIGANRVEPVSEAPRQQYSGTADYQRQPGMGSERDLLHSNYRPDQNTDGAGCCGWLLYMFSILLITFTLPFSLMFTIKVVQEYERAVIFRLGRLPSGGAKGPGIFFIIPCIESYSKVDLRTVSFDVPPQEVLTKDSVTVSVDAVVYYRVSNPTVSVANVENAHHSTRLLAQTTLRNILGTKNMSEILSDREAISHGMQSTLDEATDRWGIKVERVEIKDVRLPVQLQRAMAAEAEAAREARAKVIAAEGEQKASKALKEAADVMCQSSAALQLRYLQTLNSISAEKNSTIIFPLPIDMLSSFMSRK